MVIAGLLVGCGWSDPRFAEQPLAQPNDTGIAFMHDARVARLQVTDPSGMVVDHGRKGAPFPPSRNTHFTLRRVFWSSRPRGTTVVTVFTLPPGRYEITAWFETPIADDNAALPMEGHAVRPPLSIVIPPRGVLVGVLDCIGEQCALEESALARRRVSELLVWEMAQPHSDEEVAMWRTWLPAINRTLADRPVAP
jgi:hypothetical protein